MEKTKEEKLREKMVSDVIVSDIDKGIKKLEEDKKKMETTLKLVKSNNLDDCLEAFTQTTVLNALGRNGRELFLEKILTLIKTDELTLNTLSFSHYDFDRRWRYKTGYADLITVDAKNKTVELNKENFFKIQVFYDKSKRINSLEMTKQLNEKWAKQYDPRTLHVWKIKERKMLKEITYQIAREQHYLSQEIDNLTNGEVKKWDFSDYLNYLEGIYEDVKQIMALYIKSGFKDITTKEQEYEYFSIKTQNPMMTLKRTKKQERINKTVLKDKDDIIIDSNFVNSNDSTLYECEGIGTLLKYKEVLLYEDVIGNTDEVFNDGYNAFERVLTDSEMKELFAILKEQKQYVKGISMNFKSIYFEHSVIPVIYRITRAGKITIKRSRSKRDVNAYPFYSMSLFPTLTDIPGFRDWFNRLSVLHYTNYSCHEDIKR